MDYNKTMDKLMKLIFSRVNLGRNEVIKDLPSGPFNDHEEVVIDLSKDDDLAQLFSRPAHMKTEKSSKTEEKTQTLAHR